MLKTELKTVNERNTNLSYRCKILEELNVKLFSEMVFIQNSQLEVELESFTLQLQNLYQNLEQMSNSDFKILSHHLFTKVFQILENYTYKESKTQ